MSAFREHNKVTEEVIIFFRSLAIYLIDFQSFYIGDSHFLRPQFRAVAHKNRKNALNEIRLYMYILRLLSFPSRRGNTRTLRLECKLFKLILQIGCPSYHLI